MNIKCLAFYHPRDFSLVITTAVYSVDIGIVLSGLCDVCLVTQDQQQEAALIVKGEYNKENLRQAMPIMPQHVSCLTKETPCMQASKAVPEGPILETLPFLSYWNLNKDSRSSGQAGGSREVVWCPQMIPIWTGSRETT